MNHCCVTAFYSIILPPFTDTISSVLCYSIIRPLFTDIRAQYHQCCVTVLYYPFAQTLEHNIIGAVNLCVIPPGECIPEKHAKRKKPNADEWLHVEIMQGNKSSYTTLFFHIVCIARPLLVCIYG